MTAKGKQQHVEDSWPEKHEAWGKRQANDFCHKNDAFFVTWSYCRTKRETKFQQGEEGKALNQLKSSCQGKAYGAYKFKV